MKRSTSIFLILLLILLLVSGSLIYISVQVFYSPGPLTTNVRFVVPKGASVSHIAQLLHQKNVIPFPMFFVFGARLIGKSRTIKAGEYEFEPGTSLQKILSALTSGKPFLRKITIPEGLSSFEIINLHISLLI